MATKNDYVLTHKKSLFFTLCKIAIIIVVLILMVGLNNAVEINHIIFVNAIGIDLSPNEDNKILITLQMVPPQISSDSSSTSKKVFVTSITEPSLEEAVGKVQDYISTAVNFSHTRALIISKEVAENGIGRYLHTITSNPIFDNNMFLMISDGSAQKYLEELSENTEVNPIEYYNILSNSEKFSSSTHVITVAEFMKDLYSPLIQAQAPVCKVVKNNKKENSSTTNDKENKQENESQSKSGNQADTGDTGSSGGSESSQDSLEGKNDNTKSNDEGIVSQKSDIKIQVGGSALFNEDKLVGFATPDETAYQIMITSKIKQYSTSIPIELNKKGYNKDATFNVQITQSKHAKIKVNTDTITPIIDIKIPLNIIILDTPPGEYNYLNKDYMKQKENLIKEDLNIRVGTFIDKLQHEYQIDTLGLSKYAKLNFLTQKQLYEYNWKEKYKNAKINIDFDLNFIASNLDLKK